MMVVSSSCIERNLSLEFSEDRKVIQMNVLKTKLKAHKAIVLSTFYSNRQFIKTGILNPIFEKFIHGKQFTLLKELEFQFSTWMYLLLFENKYNRLVHIADYIT